LAGAGSFPHEVLSDFADRSASTPSGLIPHSASADLFVAAPFKRQLIPGISIPEKRQQISWLLKIIDKKD